MRVAARAIALTLLGILPFASKARAASSGGYDLGARAVYYVPADGQRGTWNPGALARYHFNERWAAEGALAYQRHLFPDTTVHSAAAQISGLRYFGESKWRGFVLAGLGFFASRIQGPEYRRNLGRLAPHVGLGGEFAVTSEWVIEADYRHVWLGDVESRDAATRASRKYRRSGEQISLGISRRFSR